MESTPKKIKCETPDANGTIFSLDFTRDVFGYLMESATVGDWALMASVCRLWRRIAMEPVFLRHTDMVRHANGVVFLSTRAKLFTILYVCPYAICRMKEDWMDTWSRWANFYAHVVRYLLILQKAEPTRVCEIFAQISCSLKDNMRELFHSVVFITNDMSVDNEKTDWVSFHRKNLPLRCGHYDAVPPNDTYLRLETLMLWLVKNPIFQANYKSLISKDIWEFVANPEDKKKQLTLAYSHFEDDMVYYRFAPELIRVACDSTNTTFARHFVADFWAGLYSASMTDQNARLTPVLSAITKAPWLSSKSLLALTISGTSLMSILAHFYSGCTDVRIENPRCISTTEVDKEELATIAVGIGVHKDPKLLTRLNYDFQRRILSTAIRLGENLPAIRDGFTKNQMIEFEKSLKPRVRNYYTKYTK